MASTIAGCQPSFRSRSRETPQRSHPRQEPIALTDNSAAALKISEVSGGMARRIALARAIALDPELIMYDEPFAGLDLISMGVAAKLIRSLNDITGATSLVVSHDVPECMAISDHVILMATQGRIVAQGTPAELMASTDPEVRQFVRGEPDGPVKFHYPARPMAEDYGLKAAS